MLIGSISPTFYNKPKLKKISTNNFFYEHAAQKMLMKLTNVFYVIKIIEQLKIVILLLVFKL